MGGQGATLRRVTPVLLWLMVAVEVFFLVGLLVSAGTPSALVNVWLSLATQWVPVSIFWVVALRTGFNRLEVTLAAAAVTLSAIGDTYYSLAMDSSGYLAFPSPADVGYLLFYPLMVAALVVLVRRQSGGMPGIMVIESAVACLGAAAVLAVVLDPVLSGALAGSNAFDGAVALAYPLFDLVLLAVIAGIAASPIVDIGPRWWSLIVGLGIFTVADIVYALLEDQGSYMAGTPLDASWAIGLGFITWWVAGAGERDTAAKRRRRKAFVIPIPAVAVVAGLAVLIIHTQTPLSLLAVILAALTVGLAAVPIIFRQAIMGRLIADQEQVVRQLTDLDRDKSDMIVTMNHEFRTPLTSINGYVELLIDGDGGEMPPAAIGMLRVIESNAARLQDLIDDLLTMSKLESGNVADRTPGDLLGILERAGASVAALAKKQGVDVAIECDSVALVDADATQLERAFANIIENAVKFTPARGSVRVVAEQTAGAIVVRVIDTGIGIPPEDISRLFTRFFRASNAQAAAIPGAGLGLAIARGLFEAHGGRVSAESTLGHGTTVTVRLAVSGSDASMPQHEPLV
ncbi:MAG: Alkaline phosphatase synthesis sensor protein PhoR [Microbacteriaceae bacterium]|nr:Alkaline phosphatase synthesis sensor protein PhoR [Microbacteriaceae bacterium]